MVLNFLIKVFQYIKIVSMVEYSPCNHFKVMFNILLDNINNHKIDDIIEKRLKQISLYANFIKINK